LHLGIRWQNRWFQLLGTITSLPAAKKDVTVQERLDGSVRIVYRGIEQQYKEIQKPGKKEKKEMPEKAEKMRTVGLPETLPVEDPAEQGERCVEPEQEKKDHPGSEATLPASPRTDRKTSEYIAGETQGG